MLKNLSFYLNIVVVYVFAYLSSSAVWSQASYGNGRNARGSTNCKNANDKIRFRRLKLDIDNLEPPIIQTLSGKVIGKKIENDNGEFLPVIQFLGIPYAEPPVRNLRWKKPKEKRKWQGVLNATKFEAFCPQAPENLLPTALLPEWYKINWTQNISYLMSEDCLYLNIYVPAKLYAEVTNFTEPNTKKLAVMIYYHGHTYSEGSGNFYDASILASVGEVIVVTLNYRLGVLGFLSTMNPSAPGNYGLWDQLEALKWISKNIMYFGGDPNRVTAFGSGAGASSIGILMLSEQTEGSRLGNITRAWFRRAILQSGSAVANWSIAKNPKQYAKNLANNRKINCPADLSTKMMECLRKKSWKIHQAEIIIVKHFIQGRNNVAWVKIEPRIIYNEPVKDNKKVLFYQWEIIEVPLQTKAYEVAYGPVVDGNGGVLKNIPVKLLEKGEFTDYSIIIGVTQGDGFGGLRSLLKFRYNSSQSEERYSESVHETSYKEEDFDEDVFSFVKTSYKNLSNSTIRFIKEVIKFMYTDWTTHDENKLTWKKKMMDILTDSQFVKPAIQKALYQAKHNHPAYFYTFYQHPGLNEQRSWRKSVIGDEIPFVFGVPLVRRKSTLFSYNFTEIDKIVSIAMMTYWTNFAKSGVPTLATNAICPTSLGMFEDIKWPRHEFNTRSYLQISSRPQVGSYYRAKKVEIWNKFLPIILNMSARGMKFDFVPISEQQSTYKPKYTWTNRDPTFTTGPISTSQNSNPADSNDLNNMSVQLSMTLAVGFVLLFVNIIAFAIVSYRKEQDKIVIAKLKSELVQYRRRDVARKSRNKSPKQSRNHMKTICSDSVLEMKMVPVNQYNSLKTLPNKFSNSIPLPERQEESISSPNDSIYGVMGPAASSKSNYLLSVSELRHDKYIHPSQTDYFTKHFQNETNAELSKEFADMLNQEKVVKSDHVNKIEENYTQENSITSVINENGMAYYPNHSAKLQFVTHKSHNPLRKTLPKQSRFSSSVCTSENGSEKENKEAGSQSNTEIYSFRENDFSGNFHRYSPIPLRYDGRTDDNGSDRKPLLTQVTPFYGRRSHYNSQPLFNEYRQQLVRKQLSESSAPAAKRPQTLCCPSSIYPNQPEPANMSKCELINTCSTTTTKL